MTCKYCGAQLDEETLVQIGTDSFCTVECHRTMRHEHDQDKREKEARADAEEMAS